MSQKINKKHKRLYLINRDFQLRYAAAAVLVGLLSTLLTTVLILIPLYQFEILRIPRFLPWPVLFMMLSAAFVNISLVGLMSVHVTHRLAGPMYSLVRHIRRIEEGHWYGELRLREDDELKFVVRNFNEMVASIRKKAEDDLAALEEIRMAISEHANLQSLQNAVNDIARLEANLKERLGGPTQQNLAG